MSDITFTVTIKDIDPEPDAIEIESLRDGIETAVTDCEPLQDFDTDYVEVKPRP
jgi:hypothetical protein